MNDLLQGTAPHPKTRREEPMQRSGETPITPGAGLLSIATRTRRHSPARVPARVRAALSGRRRTGGLPGPGRRPSDGSGVSPIASGASRGVALLVGR